MSRRINFFIHGIRSGALVVALISASIFSAAAQPAAKAEKGPSNPLQGFSQNNGQPIQIEAAHLEVRDKQKVATFSGGVKVIQGDTTMRCKSLVVFYDSAPAPSTPSSTAAVGPKSGSMQAATPGPGGSSSIRRLEAKGSVVVMQKDQVVTGETAVFDPRANLITMVGGTNGVVLTQCRNVLTGDRLKVDMTTGVSRVESDSKVKVLLEQSGQGCASAPAGPKPAPAAMPLLIPGKK